METKRYFTTNCNKRRRAANLIAHVYYDGTWSYCRKGEGCKENVRAIPYKP